jgi:hypothetical protein
MTGPSPPPPSTDDPARPSRVECRPATDPAIRLFVVAAMLIGFGIWCLTDRRQRPEAWDFEHINQVATYLLNNWGPFLLLPAGAVFLYFGVRFVRRVLVADEEGIGYSPAGKIRWDEVTALDATRLPDGFLVLQAGQDRRLKLDSWKLKGFRELVAFVEQRVPQEKWARPKDKAATS